MIGPADDDSTRLAALGRLHESFLQVAGERSLALQWNPIQDNNATPCDPALTASLQQSLAAVTGSRLTLASGAGHDGVVISSICPIAMLFIRCRDGLSHHPSEFASPADIGIGIAVLTHFLKTHPA